MSCTLSYTCGLNGLRISARDEFVISDMPRKIHCGGTMSFLTESEDHSDAPKIHCKVPNLETLTYPRDIEVHPYASTTYTSEESGNNRGQPLQVKEGAKQQQDNKWNCDSDEGLKVDVPPCKESPSVEDNVEDPQRKVTEVDNCCTKKTSCDSFRMEEAPLYNCMSQEQTRRQVRHKKLTVKVRAKLVHRNLGIVEGEKKSKSTKLCVIQSQEKKIWILFNNYLNVYSCMVLASILQQLCMCRLSIER